MQLFRNIIIIWLHMLVVNLISSQVLSFPFPSSSPPFPSPIPLRSLRIIAKQVAFSVDVIRLSSATELDIVPQWQRTVSATVALSVSLCCCTSVFVSVSVSMHARVSVAKCAVDGVCGQNEQKLCKTVDPISNVKLTRRGTSLHVSARLCLPCYHSEPKLWLLPPAPPPSSSPSPTHLTVTSQ